jgi:hypothetical protein
MLADVVVVIHLAVVLFIAAGPPLIYLGAARDWAWVRAWRWRLLHLLAVVLVAALSALHIACPLTVWEDWLRGQRFSVGFIERWVDRVLFYDFPAWVFILIYTGYAALVAVTWLAVPPRGTRHSR